MCPFDKSLDDLLRGGTARDVTSVMFLRTLQFQTSLSIFKKEKATVNVVYGWNNFLKSCFLKFLILLLLVCVAVCFFGFS